MFLGRSFPSPKHLNSPLGDCHFKFKIIYLYIPLSMGRMNSVEDDNSVALLSRSFDDDDNSFNDDVVDDGLRLRR